MAVLEREEREAPRVSVGAETVKPHRVLWQLDVDDEQRRQPLFPRHMRLITQCRQRRQLHMLRDVAQAEVEGIEVHVQQPAEFVVWVHSHYMIGTCKSSGVPPLTSARGRLLLKTPGSS